MSDAEPTRRRGSDQGKPPDPLVSVIIPCYNAEAYVGEAIESALGQSHEPVEVIVVDDDSTDGSLDVIQSYGERIVWRTQENQGAPVARNHGLSLASGEFVKFLDADDALREGVVAKQIRESRQLCDEHAVVFGDQSGENLTQDTGGPPGSDEAPLEYLVGPGINTVCPLHRRELLTNVEGFTEGLPCGQEYEMHIRMKLAGTRFFYRPGPALRVSRIASSSIGTRTFAGRDPAPRISLFEHMTALLDEAFGGQTPDRLRVPLARRWWITGRQALRGGHTHAAKRCFSAAREMNSECVVGSRGYRIMTQTLGPLWAERAGTWMKKVGVREG